MKPIGLSKQDGWARREGTLPQLWAQTPRNVKQWEKQTKKYITGSQTPRCSCKVPSTATLCWPGEGRTLAMAFLEEFLEQLGHDSAVSGMTGGTLRNPLELLLWTISDYQMHLMTRTRIWHRICSQFFKHWVHKAASTTTKFNFQTTEDPARNHCRALPEISQIKLQISDQLKLTQLSKDLFC